MAGKYVVVGASGNGKTTFSRRLADKLNVPYIELDALNHLPGWQEASEEDFRRSVDEATSGDGWVADGSYYNRLGPFLFERADVVVWLDQPVPLVMTRLVRRAIRDFARSATSSTATARRGATPSGAGTRSSSSRFAWRSAGGASGPGSSPSSA